MSDQHPGVEDEVERALRLGLATASQMADRSVRAWQDLARQAQNRDQQEARQLEARYRAEGASATARLAVVDRTEWWDHATPADITSMWHLAAQWQDEQPRAAIAVEAIARQVQDRYDIDVRVPGVDAETVRAALTRLEAEQSDRTGRPQDHDDTATAVGADG
jgi:GTP cyclohydrolase III